ncbi:MAG: TIM44-like domain-containing protein [Alphaproteobacteria bacterium]|nr:TIM44-like domain-containing protein [Alphaproteobacteria bacterium]
MSFKPTLWLTLLLAVFVCLAPTLADARAGGGSSVGSRGTRTYNSVPSTPTAPQSQTIQRSVTPQPSPAVRPAAPAMQPGIFGGHPFMSGLMGGLIGAGLAGLLFGHGFFGYGLGFAGIIGLLLQLALVALLIRLAMSYFRSRPYAVERRNFAYATADDSGPHGKPYAASAGGGGGAPAARDEIGITGSDYAEFERLLVAIQTAWSGGDIDVLRRHITPEMLSYFSEKLSANTSAGIENKVEDVRFEAGDLAEAWNDGDLQYATVALRWSARDYTVRADTRVPVEGDSAERVTATEVWTFVRAPGGRWLLSAIQQV